MPPEEVVLYECSILRGFGSEEERMDNRFAISDEEYQVILQEMTGGEFACYDTLLAAAQRLIEPYCKSRCGATTDAWEEIRQEALFRIFRGCENSFFYGNLQEEKGAVALTRWIYRVTANCLKDYWASAKRQSEGRLALLSAILQQNGIPADLDEDGLRLAGWRVTEDAPREHGLYASATGLEDGQDAVKDRVAAAFETILKTRAELHVVLAWLAVNLLIYIQEVPRHEAVEQVAGSDCTLTQWMQCILLQTQQIDWLRLEPAAFYPLAQRLEETGPGGKLLGDCRFSDFTSENVRTFLSKAISKRNANLRKGC